MSDCGRPLAANLRAARTNAGLSVIELARRARIGRATLTQLEAGAGNPTLETLYALADELGIALADLIADPEPSTEARVLRRGQGRHTQGAVVEAWLLRRHHHAEITIELYGIVLHPGPAQHSRAHPPGTREHLHLTSGHALVGPADVPLELTAGDYADYPADIEHTYRALPVPGTTGAGADTASGTLLILTPTARSRPTR